MFYGLSIALGVKFDAVGAGLCGHINHFGVGVDVELGGCYRLYVINVNVAYVSLVGAKMDGDALCASSLAVDSELFHIRDVTSACVADGSDFVDA